MKMDGPVLIVVLIITIMISDQKYVQHEINISLRLANFIPCKLGSFEKPISLSESLPNAQNYLLCQMLSNFELEQARRCNV
jgi:hypothetical protein